MSFSMSVGAQVAMPTVYGVLNKEVRWVDQDDKSKPSDVMVTDVDGFESRFGFHGDAPWETNKFLYKLEVGYNSNGDSAASNDRIRVRLAQGTFQTERYGSLTFGQAWLPVSLWLLKFDPLGATGMENFSLDTSYVKGSTGIALRGLGYTMKTFSDQLSYATPTYAGLQYVITYDQRAEPADFERGTQKTYEHMLTYDNGTEATVKVRAMLSHTDEYYSFPGQKRDINTAATSLAYGPFGMQLSMGNEKNNSNSVDYDRMFAGLTYNIGEAQLVATYGTLSKGSNPGKETQIAGGVKYMLTPKIRWTLLYGNYKVDAEGTNIVDKSGDGVADSDTNAAHIVTTGLRLDF